MDLRWLFHLLVLLSVLFLSACATLNKEECLHAEWRQIGFEDGAAGRNLSFLKNHREACAEHGITPDRNNYKRGHAEGLQEFCIPENGFAQGKNGYSYNGVCPRDLESKFLAAYKIGKDIHQLNRTIKDAQAEIDRIDEVLEQVRSDMGQKEQLLIDGKNSPGDRALLLTEIRDLQQTEAELLADIEQAERGLARDQTRLKRLERQHNY